MPYLLSISFVYLPYLQSSLLFAAGTDCGSQHRIQTKSKTRVMQAANAVHGLEDTATSTPKLPQKGISRKTSRAGNSEPLPAPKKVAVSQTEGEEMPDGGGGHNLRKTGGKKEHGAEITLCSCNLHPCH